MKILFLGDYSSLFSNLKDGLIELGHDAVIAANGDGFKSIPCDVNFRSSKNGILGKIETRLLPFMKMNEFKNFDVVQLINPFEFSVKGFHPKFFFNFIKKNNGRFFMSAAGDDAFFWTVGRARLAYGPFDDYLKFDIKKKKYWMESRKAISFNKWMVDQVDGVIPIMYEYEISYSDQPKRLATIPIPVNTKKIEYQENKVGNKIVIFHGLNRYGFKGTRHVEKAFEYLRSKYPNDLELVIDGKMPLDAYLSLMRRTNVVIDQTNTYSIGVNGVYALAMGKVVMGGAEPESLNSLGVEESPVINLKPSSESIIESVEMILENRSSIKDIGYLGRRFAENSHGHLVVAQKYVDLWSN